MIFKLYKKFWSLSFNTLAKTSTDTFPFFIVGAPIIKTYRSEISNFLKFNLDLHFFLNVFNKFERESRNCFKSKRADNFSYNFTILNKNTTYGYKFSNSIPYSLLLESYIKDSNNYSPYFQFFHFVSELGQNEKIEDISSELDSFMLDFSEFCKFIYFIGFGSNILVNYNEFKLFIDFWLKSFNINTNSNTSFISNFLFNFFCALLRNFTVSHIII